MSYIYNNKIAYADTPNLDAFGRLRVATVTNLLDIKHSFDKNPLLVSEVTAGTATSVFNQEFARVRMSAGTNGDYVVRKSKISPIYQPGKSQLFEGSFSNFQIENNIIKRVGCFNSSTASTYDTQFDGFFLESNGITSGITFNIYRTGTLVFSSDTTNWFNSEINSNLIDWTNTNLMLVDYQWLGVGRMRLGMVISGITYYFTEHTSIGDEPNVYMSSPNQPIRYEIRSSGGIGYLDMICSQISTEGPLSQGLFQTTSIVYSADTLLGTPGTKYAYMGYRINPQYRNTNIKLDNIPIINDTNDSYLITVELNPTLNFTPTWTDLPDTPIQYSLGTGGTNTVTSNGFVISSVVGEAGSISNTVLNVTENIIQSGVNVDGSLDTIWICVTPFGNTAKFRGVANLRYYL